MFKGGYGVYMERNLKFKIGLERELSSKELLVLSNLFLSVEYPKSFLTLDDVVGILGCCKATALKTCKSLESLGLVVKVAGFVSFYYPVADDDIRRYLLRKVGFLNE